VVGTESPIKRFKREVFPHPFLPSKANRALEETLNSTSLKRDASPGHAKEAFVMLTSFSLLQRKRERVGARVRGCLEEEEEGGGGRRGEGVVLCMEGWIEEGREKEAREKILFLIKAAEYRNNTQKKNLDRPF
jgi:hypothetical protein